jgi:hypothetical protein
MLCNHAATNAQATITSKPPPQNNKKIHLQTTQQEAGTAL